MASNKYITFLLGNETYGIAVEKVLEVIQMLPITPLPHVPGYVSGMINLRGKIIPVVDLHLCFCVPEKTPPPPAHCIIVANIRNGEMLVGFIVDGVEEVLQFADDKIEPSLDPSKGYIRGLVKHRGTLHILLDMEQVLTEETLAIV